ncbi:MMPL family transporter [Prauserella oleivorans]|uniref:MMPL family transporter n=7 Tax=Pseudonocardiaceae TaxID=2070 RepID=A0A8E1W6B6_9PSEU|nr:MULTISPECIES: MMPL family transporter [Pseudonocardiaceae]PXY16914.1 transporter [Prauserella coralliicola]AXB46159.1 transporter [Amycolatopsis albispora]MBB2504985.1 MMPL family transporter [Amycolatopsis echigonensis]PXY17366.1 transporter [Prauserella muralis]PXY25658.1 transporter [Prauserella flavalba]
MSTFLYRLGRTAFGRPWLFIAGWLAALAVVVGAVAINGVSVSSEMKIEGTEAQTVLDRVADELPAASGGQASVVFTAPDGERLDTAERLAVISGTVSDVYDLDKVVNPLDLATGTSEEGTPGTPEEKAPGTPPAGPDHGQAPPYQPLLVDGAPVPGVLVSSDGQVALFQFQFTVASTSLTPEDVSSVVEVVERAEQGTGITVLPSDSLKAIEIPVGVGEVIGLAVAALVLVLTLGSLIAAGLPLITALVGIGIGVGGAYALSTAVEMNSATPVLGLMVGLAVGIDYALFVVNRQRRLILDQGLTAQEAAGRAVGTAGSAVFFAGLTVLIALTALTVIDIAMLSTMALVAASTVALAVLIALTLLPALLGLVGERICSDKARARRYAKADAESHSVADHWVKGVIRFRWPVIGGVVAILGVMAIPAASMNLGIPTGATANQDTAARQSYEAVSQGFGEGFNGPLLVTAEPTGTAGRVTPELTAKLADEFQHRDDIVLAAPVGVNEAGDLAVFSVIPTSGPSDEATSDLVKSLREPSNAIAQSNQVRLGVTGFTAIGIDMSDKLADVLPLYLGIIIVLSVLILMLVFRSVVVPIKATAGFLLSILATFGATTAVFQWGWLSGLFGFDTGGPLMSFMPIIVTGILYGLAMDYEVFLVSSMREAHIHGQPARHSVVHGFDQASRVVVAAAIIMVAVFSGFIFSHDIMIKQIGFALAAGILIDAFVVRLTLVPALMALFGERAWWLPRWLDRLLPDLDVEGDKLLTMLNQQAEATDRHHIEVRD